MDDHAVIQAGSDSGWRLFTGAIGQFPEDHATGAVLEDAGDSDGDVAAGKCGGIFADDHGAVIEVSDTLAGAITIPDDANIEAFAGDMAWLQGVRDVIKIDDRNALHAGNFVQVEIIGDDTAAHLFGERHNFLIDGHHAKFVA